MGKVFVSFALKRSDRPVTFGSTVISLDSSEDRLGEAEIAKLGIDLEKFLSGKFNNEPVETSLINIIPLPIMIKRRGDGQI